MPFIFLLYVVSYLDRVNVGSAGLQMTKELGFSESTMLGLFLMVQFVAFGGALLFGRLALRFGAWKRKSCAITSRIAWSTPSLRATRPISAARSRN